MGKNTVNININALSGKVHVKNVKMTPTSVNIIILPFVIGVFVLGCYLLRCLVDIFWHIRLGTVTLMFFRREFLRIHFARNVFAWFGLFLKLWFIH